MQIFIGAKFQIFIKHIVDIFSCSCIFQAVQKHTADLQNAIQPCINENGNEMVCGMGNNFTEKVTRKNKLFSTVEIHYFSSLRLKYINISLLHTNTGKLPLVCENRKHDRMMLGTQSTRGQIIGYTLELTNLFKGVLVVEMDQERTNFLKLYESI